MYVLIQPDVLKVEKCYWYKITDETKSSDSIIIGSIIKVIFNGRKIRGWVVEVNDSLPEDIDASEIKPILEFVSQGPLEKMVSLSSILAKYYLVSPVIFLRMSSPSVDVKGSTLLAKSSTEKDEKHEREVVYVNPRENRKDLILNEIPNAGSIIIITPGSRTKIAHLVETVNKNVVVIGVDGKIPKNLYQKMLLGNCVVISSRKAIFANVPDLKSILVLDDGFEQLRDERTPKFHVVDVAKIRAEFEGCKLKVITSVPTTVTHDLKIDENKIEKDAWPKIHIEDLTKTDPTLGNYTHKFISAIKKAHESNLEVAIITNNTSMARKIICKDCSTICVCEKCGHNVSFIDSNHYLECSVCKTRRATVCSICKSIDLKMYRKGTKSLKGELQKLIPSSNVLEVEKGNEEYPKFKSTINNIYIATEAIFHKSDLIQNVGLVIFLDFDSYLLRPRADAFEQSLVSVTRALRILKKSALDVSLMLLTKMANHEMLIDLKESDFISHLKRDLALKEVLGVAPFKATAQLKIKPDDFDDLKLLIGTEIIDGFIDGEVWKTVALSANTHDELTQKAYIPIRKFASKHRLTLNIDSYE